MIVFAVAIAVLFWVAVFVAVFADQGISVTTFLLGRFEPPPADLGTWKESGFDEASSAVREERLLLPDNNPSASYLLYQVRYRDRGTRAIVRAEPEQRIRRRRVSVRGF